MRAFHERFVQRYGEDPAKWPNAIPGLAYDMALTDGPEALAQAIGRNVLDGWGIEDARRLASYATATIAILGKRDAADLANGSWSFPRPQLEIATP